MTDWTSIDNKLLDANWYTTTEYHDVFKALRDEDPLHWAEDDHYGRHYWVVTRYDDVKWYLTDHPRLSSRWDTRIPKSPKRRTPEERYELGMDVSLGRNDPPIHELYRRPMNKHFSVPAVKKLAAETEAIVDEIIADVADLGSCDLVEDIAGELPVRVILRMLGVPEEDWPMLREASWQWLASADPKFMIDDDPVHTALHGQRRLMEYCENLALERRTSPQDDFATVIGNMEIDGDKLSLHEMRSYLTILIGGGLETTRNAAAVGLWQFLENPDQRQLLLDDPSLTNSAMEEVVRWVTPGKNRLRIANEAIELHGKTIRAGDWVVAFQASANKDERVFHDPHRFDITRDPNPHLAYGEGIHMCLGRALARLELGTLIPKVLRAFPDLETSAEPTWIADNVTTGFTSLPVRYSPRSLAAARN
ncbi:cytochrome P450 [Rhodococcus artemisiae]|uniref:Cytochrome P450 n=1 Tax=Rhodococcus artemisiae TaxID=714159 RepID=A0ABU7LC65_9NOCA|nr:cytochrome P450 [Rhodococcus artemisiae]MEE2059141.1 cytochrome P450 [Rhodococcus artemisiae]